MRATKVEILREAVTKIVPILAGRGLTVTQIGTHAHVRYHPKTNMPICVNIPHLPDDAPADLITAIHGFIDHEVAHVLFSDAKALDAANKSNVAALTNILEDTFIERKMKATYKGSSENLISTWQFVHERLVKPDITKALVSGDLNKMMEASLVSMIRFWSGQKEIYESIKEVLPLLDRHIKAIGQDLIDKIPEIACSMDSYRLAAAMQNRLEELQRQQREEKARDEEAKKPKAPPAAPSPGKPEPPKGDEESGAAPSSSSAPSAGKGSPSGGKRPPPPKKDEEEEEPPEPESEDEDEEEEGADGGAGDEGDPDDEEESEEEGGSKPDPESASDDEEESEDEESDGGSDGDSEDDEEGEDEESGTAPPPPPMTDVEDPGEDEEEEEASTPSVAPPTKGERPTMEVDEDELGSIASTFSKMKDMDTMMNLLISDRIATTAAGAPYYALTKDFDEIKEFKPSVYTREQLLVMLDQLQNDVSATMAPLQRHLERLITARSQSRYIPGYRSGRIDSANLHRIPTGEDRLFRRKYTSKTKDACVSLVVDMSGSMSGEKVHLAIQSVFALSSSLDKLNINHEVIGFTTTNTPRHTADGRDVYTIINDTSKAIGRGFSRVEPIYCPIFKPFNTKLTTERKLALAGYREIALRNNVDGESVEYAGRRLAAQKESRKIMIVLSDGQPHSSGGSMAEQSSHLKTVIGRFTEAGIETFGVGIQTSAVGHYYPKFAVLHEISELPKTIMGELERMLLSKAA